MVIYVVGILFWTGVFVLLFFGCKRETTGRTVEDIRFPQPARQKPMTCGDNPSPIDQEINRLCANLASITTVYLCETALAGEQTWTPDRLMAWAAMGQAHAQLILRQSELLKGRLAF